MTTAALTIEGNILVEIDAVGHWKLSCLNVKGITFQVPRKVGCRDHMGGEFPKRLLISDVECGRIVDRCTFVRGLES